MIEGKEYYACLSFWPENNFFKSQKKKDERNRFFLIMTILSVLSISESMSGTQGMKMKKVLLFTALSACAVNAFAANTVDMKVVGVLTNSACTPSFPNGGKVDFGKTSLTTMSATDVNQLGYRDVDLTLTCDSATALAFTASDAHNDSAVIQLVGGRAGSANEDFGLGKTAGGVNLGAYTILLKGNPTVDDVVTPALYATTALTPTWSVAGANSYVHTKGDLMFTTGDGTSKVPTAFKKAVFPLRVTASVQNTATLAITDDTNLDGLATFSIVYL